MTDHSPTERPVPRTLVALRAAVPGVVRAGVETVSTVHGERPVMRVRVGATDRAGALTPRDGETIAAAAQTALQQRLPVVVDIASTGADIREGLAALHGWGLAARALTACSGIVPTIMTVDGPAVSGPALLLGLADHVIMTNDAYAFVTGPHMVRQFTGEPITAVELGGSGLHARVTGVAALVVADAAAADAAVEALFDLLPGHNDELPPRIPTDDPADRSTPEAGAIIPDTATGSYDVRSVIRAIVDDGELLELRAAWAPNLVTAFAAIDGRPVGFVANQPCALAGTLDIPASQKGARFVSFCDAFNIPIVTLVDTPGFYPGKDLEWRGMIRHGAQMAFAYARATVPRVNVTLRKSYGGAYIVMDSKRMGNDLALAWPSAEIAVMGAKGAVEILHRRASVEERLELEAAYEARLLSPYIAADRGFIDAVIDPADTRRELAAALGVLEDKREQLRPRGHDNSPL
ncbi:MAG: methylmalonyl-CoA carboxyltransferase [Actinobacteria bacterium]|nr:methylmalonyl-CoA carboxyltransferase [Actinomycetota bacterium]MTA77296.1 methylmalonyl-CoA carboxyltransferase [Actinomycetota bacterium]